MVAQRLVITSPPFAWSPSDASVAPSGALDRRKVTQCALSRVCGGCGQSLGRPIAFVGTAEEVGRNEFHAPPLHATCADELVRTVDPSWQVVTTGGFEFVRPTKDDVDRAVRFVPNSLIG